MVRVRSYRKYVVEVESNGNTWVHSKDWTKEKATRYAAKLNEVWNKEGMTYRARPQTEEETVPEYGELVDEAIEKAAKEAAEDARGRCTVPPWAFDKCIEVQDWVLGELRLQLMNDQDLYEQGPYSVKYRPMLFNVLDGAEVWADIKFKPHAEEELREMQEIRISEEDPEKRRDQLAHEIADRLWAPVVEEYAEIPREQREIAVKETMKAVRGLIEDYTTALRASWPRRER